MAEIHSRCQQYDVPGPGLRGKQTFGYGAELIPVWLKALNTSSRSSWSLPFCITIIVLRLSEAPFIVLLFGKTSLLYHQKMSMWVVQSCGLNAPQLCFTSSVCTAENEHLFTSPDAISVYLIAKHNPNCHLAMPAPSPIICGSLKVTKCCHV